VRSAEKVQYAENRKGADKHLIIMKITANGNDTNDIVCKAMMMIKGVIETFAICRLYRFHWP